MGIGNTKFKTETTSDGYREKCDLKGSHRVLQLYFSSFIFKLYGAFQSTNYIIL